MHNCTFVYFSEKKSIGHVSSFGVNQFVSKAVASTRFYEPMIWTSDFYVR